LPEWPDREIAPAAAPEHRRMVNPQCGRGAGIARLRDCLHEPEVVPGKMHRLLIGDTPENFANRSLILQLAADHRLPVVLCVELI